MPKRFDSVPVPLVRLGVVAFLLWTAVAVGGLLVAALVSARFARRLGPDTARVADLVERAQGIQGVVDAARLLARYRSEGQAAISSLALLVADSSRYAVEPRRALGASEVAGLSLLADAVRRSAAIPEDTLRLLRALGNHPQAAKVPQALAGGTGYTLPATGIPALRQALEANGAGAVSATADGRPDEAARRFADNGRAALAALEVPGRLWPDAALRMLVGLALLPLAELEALRGQPEAAAELRAVAQRVSEAMDDYGPSWLVGAIGLAGDPRDLRLLDRLASSSGLPPGLELGAREAAAEGTCLNPRELLARSDPRRPPGSHRGVPGIGGALARVRHCSAQLRTTPRQ
jgi:hypothetical protein